MLKDLETIEIKGVDELLEKVREAKVKMLEQDITDIIFNTSKENIQYIHDYYQSEIGTHEIKGVYGMKIKIVDLPKNITFVLTEDQDKKTIRSLRDEISRLNNKINEIKGLL